MEHKPDQCLVCGASPVIGWGWCHLHYHRWWKHGDPLWEPARLDPGCSVDGCEESRRCRGLCGKHYRRWQRGADLVVSPAIGRRPTHGMSRTPIYRSWLAMRARCTEPEHHAWKNYGGRGITVCGEWMTSFEAFRDYVGERPGGMTLDRWPDPDGNYEPGNVRWATLVQQRANRRRSA